MVVDMQYESTCNFGFVIGSTTTSGAAKPTTCTSTGMGNFPDSLCWRRNGDTPYGFNDPDLATLRVSNARGMCGW